MAQFVNLYKVELNNGSVPVVSLKQIHYGDAYANRIGAIVYIDGQPAQLSGTCSGMAILENVSTVPMTGTVSGNTAYVDLDPACYSVEGQIRVFVKLTTGDVTCTLLAAVGNVALTETGVIIDPGTIIPSVSALIAEIEEAKASIPLDYSEMSAAVTALQAMPTDTVRYDASQSLTDAQKTQARGNISAAGAQDVAALAGALGVQEAEYTTSTGHYVNTTGSYESVNSGRMTNGISLSANQTIVVDYSVGTSTGIGVIATENSGSYTVLASNGASAAKTHFEYTAPEATTVYVSWITTSSTPRTVTIKIKSPADLMVKSENVLGLDAALAALDERIDQQETQLEAIGQTADAVYTTTTGHYINNRAEYESVNSGRMTSAIALTKGQKIIVDYSVGTTTNIGTIASVDNGVYAVLVSNSGSFDKTHFEYTAPAAMNVVVSWITTSGTPRTVTIKIQNASDISVKTENVIGLSEALAEIDETIGDLDERLDTQAEQIEGIDKTADAVYTTTTGHYINTLGSYESVNSGRMTSAIALNPDQTIVVDYSVGTSTGIGVIAKEASGSYTVLVSNSASTAKTHFEYTAKEAITVYVSWITTTSTPRTVTIKIKSPSDLMVRSENVVGLNDQIGSVIDGQIPWEYALDKILCIGDSLTYGAPAASSMPSRLRQNYPWYISRMLNTTITNAGVSGISTINWYNNQYENYNMANFDAVIIFLGTNGLFTDTLETDVDPYESYEDYAETNTGCYCKLIERIQEDNPNCNIVLVNIWRESNASSEMTSDTAREVINKIGARYSLPVVQTKDLAYSYSPQYHAGHDNVHMAKSGYLALAARIVAALRQYISKNIGYANKGMTAYSN